MKTVIVMSLLLIACSRGKPAERLIAFGDSHTAFWYSYASVLSVDLDLKMVNNAVPGSTFTQQSSGWLAFEYRQEDVVVTMVSFNDIMIHGEDHAHLAEYRQKLAAALVHASPRVRRIVVGTPIRPLTYFGNGTQAAADAYVEATREVVTDLALSNVLLVDVYANLALTEADFITDRVHLTPAGERRVSALYREAL